MNSEVAPSLPPTETPPQRYLSTSQVADQLQVNAGKVIYWISSGQLRAVNVAASAGGRPRWRIAAAELEAFLLRRSGSPAAVPRPRRRRQADPEVIRFF